MNADALLAAYEAKARAELGDAEALASGAAKGWRGRPLGALAFVIGAPSDADAQAGEPLRGEAGEAAAKAAEAFGVCGADVVAIASRPVAGLSAAVRARRLRLAVEAADPAAVIALDAEGAQDLAAAFEIEALDAGRPVLAHGRTLGSAGDLAASLADAPAKVRVWRAMKAIAHAAGLTGPKTKGRPKAPSTQPSQAPGSEA